MKKLFKNKTSKQVLLVLSLALLVGAVTIVLAAMSYTGYTDETASGQTIKVSSAATAILGININDGGENETLTSVSIDFTSVSGFTANDLAAGKTGVTIYSDTGATQGSFDGTDSDVGASVTWSGLTATVNTAGTAIPDDNADNNAGDDFFVVIRTSASIANGDQFTAALGTNSLITSASGQNGASYEETNTITADTGVPTLSSAVRDSNTQITVTLSEVAAQSSITKGNDGGFVVHETGAPATTYTVASIAPGATNDKVVLTVDNFLASGKEGITVDYTAGGNGTVTDAAGNALATNDIGLSIDAWDSTGPTVTNVTSTKDNGSYKSGVTIDVTVTFSEAVYKTGTPTITLATGGAGGAVNYSSGDGTDTLTFTYTVGAGDTSSDLDYVAVDSLAGTIKDTAGNAATLTLPTPGEAGSLGANKNIVVDTTAPTILNAYRVSDTNLIVEMSEAVSGGFGETANGFTVNKTGAAETTYTVSNTAQGTSTSLVSLTVTNMLASGAAGVTVKYSADTGAIADGASNVLATDGTGVAVGAWDSTGPTVTNVTSTKDNGSYKSGVEIAVTVQFSETVTVVGTPTITLATGGAGDAATYSIGSGSDTLTFTYTVGAGDTSSDLDYVAVDSLAQVEGSTIKDTAGNAATLTLPTPGEAGSLGANKDIVVDTTAPTILNAYRVSDTNLIVEMSEAVSGGFGETANGFTVNKTGAAETTYTVSNTAQGTSTSLVSLTVTNMLASGAAGVTVKYSADTGAIADGASNVLATDGTGVAVGAWDLVAPTVTNVTSDLSNGSYKAGQVVDIDVTFSENVISTGNVTVTLDTGGSCTFAVNDASTGTCNYTVAEAQTSSNLTVSAITGTVKDIAGNTMTVPATPSTNLGANKSIIIDTTAPTLPTTGIVGASIQDASDTITITFNEPVKPASNGSWSTTEFTALESPNNTAKTLVGATFTPSSGLTSSVVITLAEGSALNTYLRNGNAVAVTVAENTIQDAAGNYVAAGEVVSSTTVSGDNEQPSVVLTYSPDRTVMPFETIRIIATFSEAMYETTVPTIAISTPGDGDLTATNMTKTSATAWYYDWSVPGNNDEQGTATITITGTDLAGKSNTTASNNTRTIDSIAPVVNTFTAESITATGATLTVTTNEAANCSYSNTEKNYASMTAMEATGGTTHTQVLTGLTGSTSYNYYVRCADSNSNTMGYSAHVGFTTLGSDTAGPTADSQSPSNGTTGVAITTTPTVTFSEDMATTTVNSTNIQLRKGIDDSVVASTITYSNKVATIIPAANLANNTDYWIWVSGATDVAGNYVTASTTESEHTFTTVDVANGTLALTIPVVASSTRSYATANDDYANGWAWDFYITVPTTETKLQLKFSDWAGASATMPAANNMRIYSAQASASSTPTTAGTITAANTYSTIMTLDGELTAAQAAAVGISDPATLPGRQIRVTVEAKVPSGTGGGSYSTSYQIHSAE